MSQFLSPSFRLFRALRCASGLALCLGGLALLLASGCAHKPQIVEIEPRFSMNIAKPPLGFPGKDIKLTPAESEVMERRGKPDFIRIWWRPDGSLITSSDLSGKRDMIGEMINTSKKSWIYVTDEKEAEEVLFRGAGYTVRPLDEKWKLICKYGDPSNRSAPIDREGHTYETWQWIEFGLQVEWMDGTELRRTHFAASGSGTYLGK